jgi:hypothetical protein
MQQCDTAVPSPRRRRNRHRTITAGGAGQNEEQQMNQKNNGGAAFPLKEALTSDNEGMTLRDYFAAQCCAAMVSTVRDDRDYDRLRMIAEAHDLGSVSQFFAQEAYKQADAMLAERAK